MTDQEIEKLREKLGSEYSVKRQNGAITVELVDIWDGVEFAEINGDIFKIDKYDSLTFYYNGWLIYKSFCKPSTESAYVEQLKAKAKELYGEIKDGERFERGTIRFPKHNNYAFDWEYDKETDELELFGFLIYQQGEWARKVERPIRVNVSSVRYLRDPIEYMGELIPSDTIDCTVHFTIEGSSPKIILKDDFRNLLAKFLEYYLNKKS